MPASSSAMTLCVLVLICIAGPLAAAIEPRVAERCDRAARMAAERHGVPPDVMMAIMATINLIALILLAPIAVKVMKNYEAQRRRGEEPTFNGSDIPGLTGLDAWDGTDVITTGAFWTQQMKRVGKA